MSQPVRPFLGESAESRVQSRRRQLLDKAFEQMADGTWQQTSIAQLCREVSLNKRYFYESFQDLEELENAVVNDLTTQLLGIGWKSVADAQANKLDTEALARFVLRTCIAWLVKDPRRAKVLFSKASDNPHAKAHRDLVINQLGQTLSSFAVDYHHPLQPQIELTAKNKTLAKLGSALLIGGTVESVLNWVEGKIDLSLEEFTDYIARFWVALGNSAIEIAGGHDNKPATGTRKKGKR